MDSSEILAQVKAELEKLTDASDREKLAAIQRALALEPVDIPDAPVIPMAPGIPPAPVISFSPASTQAPVIKVKKRKKESKELTPDQEAIIKQTYLNRRDFLRDVFRALEEAKKKYPDQYRNIQINATPQELQEMNRELRQERLKEQQAALPAWLKDQQVPLDMVSIEPWESGMSELYRKGIITKQFLDKWNSTEMKGEDLPTEIELTTDAKVALARNANLKSLKLDKWNDPAKWASLFIPDFGKELEKQQISKGKKRTKRVKRVGCADLEGIVNILRNIEVKSVDDIDKTLKTLTPVSVEELSRCLNVLEKPEGPVEKKTVTDLELTNKLSSSEWRALRALNSSSKLDKKLVIPAMKVLLRKWRHNEELYDGLRETAAKYVEKNHKTCEIVKGKLKSLKINSWLALTEKRKESAKDPKLEKQLKFLTLVEETCRSYPLFD